MVLIVLGEVKQPVNFINRPIIKLPLRLVGPFADNIFPTEGLITLAVNIMR